MARRPVCPSSVSPSRLAGRSGRPCRSGQEGRSELTVIALPRDWCGYGALIGFKSKYGIAVSELNPDGGSGDEIEAIKAIKDNKGPQAPDVIDVGLSFGPSAKAEGLLQPYKVHDSRRRQGRRGLLDRRLLRRAVVRGECGPRQEPAGRLVRPPEA